MIRSKNSKNNKAYKNNLTVPMREIAERADLETIDGHTFIVAPVSPETIDALAAFEAEGEDRENDLEDEPGQDGEPSFVPPTGFEVGAFGPIR